MNENKPSLPQLFKGIALFTPGGDLIYCIDPSKQGHWHLHLCAALQDLLGLPEPPHFLVPGYTATIDKWLDPRTKQLRIAAELYVPVQHHQALLSAVFDTSNLVWQVASWQPELWEPMVLEGYRHQFPQLWEDHDLIVHFEQTERLSSPYAARRPENQVESHPTASSLEYATRINFTNQDSARSQQELPLSERLADTHQDTEGTLVTSYERLHSSVNLEGKAPTNTLRSLQPSPSESRVISSNFGSQSPVGYVLRLFISGHSETTEDILKKLHQLLENSLHHPYTLKIIDIFKHPEQAEDNQISATPTLLRVWPLPARRIVGDFNNTEQILRVLIAPSISNE